MTELRVFLRTKDGREDHFDTGINLSKEDAAKYYENFIDTRENFETGAETKWYAYKVEFPE